MTMATERGLRVDALEGGSGPARSTKSQRGARSYHAGLCAEDSVALHYTRSGRAVVERRWRGTAGEIDLIAREGPDVIFIEVKQSKTHAMAAEHLTPWQVQRIWQTAEEFLGGEPDGQNTSVRFDVALVDGMGRIEIVENALAA
jgi:putative endonuclease